jgi:hypothetical protein
MPADVNPSRRLPDRSLFFRLRSVCRFVQTQLAHLPNERDFHPAAAEAPENSAPGAGRSGSDADRLPRGYRTEQPFRAESEHSVLGGRHVG